MTAKGARILVIDDEPQIHRFLKPALESAGYEVERADTAAEGLRLAASRSPDAILLDLGLPDQDGQDTLAKLRAFSAVPVLVVSARDRETEKVTALDNGADDYIDKPFGVGELLARIRVALRHRRAQDGVPEIAKFQGLEIDFSHRTAKTPTETLNLSPREWDLLSLLAKNPGRVLTHKHLLTAVWGPAHTEDVQYLRVYIGQLRQKLGPAALLKTEPGVGYRLTEAP